MCVVEDLGDYSERSVLQALPHFAKRSRILGAS